MKAIFILFDSLNRLALENYGGENVKTPNFSRLANKSIVFDKHYVGSMPCMPARRDMHTGHLSFLHRSWGPLEPFDNSFPELLRKKGIYTHLITDHYHYWEDGGGTYHNRFNSYEFVRGQENDAWKAMVEPPWERFKKMYHPIQYSESWEDKYSHYMVNREYIKKEEDFTSYQCFELGLDFLNENHNADNWFLQLETFDPHEPFFSPERFRRDLPTDYDGPILDWPRYDQVNETFEECEELRANYYATVAFCDEQLGKILNYFDKYKLWKDTALIVSTDHGFLLGEHNWWAKNRMPIYEELSHIPLFLYHPELNGENKKSNYNFITQTTDLMPTVLEIFNQKIPDEAKGISIIQQIQNKEICRDSAIFGYFGGAVNVVNQNYVYFRYPEKMSEQEVYQYTIMPTHLKKRFDLEELKNSVFHPGFNFMKNIPLFKIPVNLSNLELTNGFVDSDHLLYDLKKDPKQEAPLKSDNIEKSMIKHLFENLEINEAPNEVYERLLLK
tara:strand:+ start:827 stop:2329 length:1503 start_codon:yes stop_codon:yes gene_type:complete